MSLNIPRYGGTANYPAVEQQTTDPAGTDAGTVRTTVPAGTGPGTDYSRQAEKVERVRFSSAIARPAPVSSSSVIILVHSLTFNCNYNYFPYSIVMVFQCKLCVYIFAKLPRVNVIFIFVSCVRVYICVRGVVSISFLQCRTGFYI